MTLPVLVLGDEPRSSLAVARSLHRRGIPVDVASFSAEALPLSSRAVRRFVRLPSEEFEESHRLEGLVSLIQQENYDLLVPTNDSSLGLIATHHDQLKQLVRLACPTPDAVKRVLDKDLTLDAARRCGITVPAAYEVADLNDLIAIRQQLRFPLVAKARSKREIASSTFKVRYYQTFEELYGEFESDPEFGRRNLLQEYCPGEGVGIGLLIHHGEAVAAFQHRRLKEFPSTGGVSVLAISQAVDPALLRHSLQLLRWLDWEGIAMVEFRHARETGRSVLMEVNGRYWGTVSFAIQLGIDFPFYEWQLAHGQKPRVPESYKVGAKWRWTSGYLQRFHDLFAQPITGGLGSKSRLRDLAESLPDLLPAARSALSSRSDPFPAGSEVFFTLRRLVASDVKRFIKAMLPRRALAHIAVFRSLDRKSGSAYAKWQFLRALRLRSDSRKRMPEEIRSVLFICHGNIIRSPMAGALLDKFLADAGQQGIRISTAGLSAREGRLADARALSAARGFGLTLDDHRARLLNRKMVEGADVIFVMDYLNEARLVAQYPDARRKVFLLGPTELKDPYNGTQEDVRRCYEDLRSRILALVPVLTGRPPHETLGSVQTVR